MPKNQPELDADLLAARNEKFDKPVHLELSKILKIIRLYMIWVLILTPFMLALVAYGIMSNRAEVEVERQKIESTIDKP